MGRQKVTDSGPSILVAGGKTTDRLPLICTDWPLSLTRCLDKRLDSVRLHYILLDYVLDFVCIWQQLTMLLYKKQNIFCLHLNMGGVSSRLYDADELDDGPVIRPIVLSSFSQSRPCRCMTSSAVGRFGRQATRPPVDSAASQFGRRTIGPPINSSDKEYNFIIICNTKENT